jgi:hypothetical protein
MSFKNGARSLTYHFWSLVASVDLFHWGGEQAEFIVEVRCAPVEEEI